MPAMPFVLDNEQKIAPQLRSYLLELTDYARDAIRAYPSDDPEGLHRARKAIKRLRSNLRLCRKSSFKKDRKALNALLRDAGRRLSASRDDEVMRELLHDWQAQLSPARAPRLNEALEKTVRALDSRSDPHGDLGPAVGGFLEDLERADQAIDDIPKKALKRRTLKKGFAHRHERLAASRSAFNEAPGSETLHDWRKRLKDVLYQSQLLRRVLDIPKASIRNVKAVESLIGDARDCDLAIAFTRGRLAETLTAAERQSLFRHATRRRDALVAQALAAPSGGLERPLDK
jgi:CHAD domain-containing protein